MSFHGARLNLASAHLESFPYVDYRELHKAKPEIERQSAVYAALIRR